MLILQLNNINFMCSFFSVFTLIYLILENLSTNVRKYCFPCYVDTCDVVYNLFIYLLPPIVLDNLFENVHLVSGKIAPSAIILRTHEFYLTLTQLYINFSRQGSQIELILVN